MFLSIAIAAILCSLNTLTAIIAINIAFKRDPDDFNTYVFGSMAIRFFIMLALAYFAMQHFKLDTVSFGLSLMSAYFLLIFFEVFYISSRHKNKLQNDLKNNKG
jgi:hypothetical protein